MATDSRKQLRKLLKKHFGIRPRDLHLYEVALTHKSVVSNPGLHFERLEFLGDTILDAVLADYLFHKYPGEDEGELTRRKAQMVSRTTLSAIAMNMKLHERMQYSTNREINLATISGNALEALIGAIYLEKGYRKTHKALTHKFLPVHMKESILKAQRDYKSEVLIYAQKEKFSIAFNTVNEERSGNTAKYTVELIIDGKVMGTGIGKSKKKAEQRASKEALEKLT